MRVCGVISEFNPFHNGHKYLISEIKKSGYDTVICVMSGNFVQRGDYSVLDKKKRAEIAAKNGADLVISLPFPWSSSSAEIFAKSSVSILQRLGIVDCIAFGCESDNIDSLEKCAEFLAFKLQDEIKSIQMDNPEISFAVARQQAVEKSLGKEYADVLLYPNNILAVEYLKALKLSRSNISVLAIKRCEASHDGKIIGSSTASSSFIRDAFLSGKQDIASDFISSESFDVLMQNFRTVDYDAYYKFLCGAILSGKVSDLSDICEISGGLEYAIYREALVSNDYASFFNALKFRHITDAKIRRALLFSAMGVEKKYYQELPLYTEVLASNETGKLLLSQMRKSADIYVLSKVGNIKKASDAAKEQFKLQRKSEIIFDKISYKIGGDADAEHS